MYLVSKFVTVYPTTQKKLFLDERITSWTILSNFSAIQERM
jgi:hypothetical protein